MPARLVLAAVLVTVFGCSSIRSAIGIDAGERFVLGGKQQGSFTAELLNVGPETVHVFEATASGDTVLVATLPPGAAAQASFAAGSAALLANPSRQEASVHAVVRGDTNLGMRYARIEGWTRD